MQLQPKITFKVKTINYEELYSTLVPDENFNNILNNLRNQTVWIEGVDYSVPEMQGAVKLDKKQQTLLDKYKSS